jgi:hypothetical protein
MMAPTEHVGVLYMENQRLLGEYGKLLDLLQSVCDGETPKEQVRIDRDNLTWSIEMTGKEFAEALNANANGGRESEQA